MKKLVVFDIDGTLLDSTEIDENCFVRALKDEYKVAHIDERWENYKSVTDGFVFEEIFENTFSRKPTVPETRRMIQRFLMYIENSLMDRNGIINQIRGAGEILELLNAHPEWETAVASGGWRESALFKLQQAKLVIDGTPLVTSSEEKIRERIVSLCIEKAKTHYGVSDFEKIVSVGDAAWDVKAAEQLKLAFIGIGNSGRFKMFPGCKHVEDFKDRSRFLRYLDESEVPRVPRHAL
ncbi:MAG: HAD family phosphatase [bacterium]|nr:HAD family phosphatase [bacterium]